MLKNNKIMNFEDYKEEIKNVVTNRMISFFPQEEDFILLNYFAEINLFRDAPSTGPFSATNIPVVLVVGKTTGLVYHFSLKLLLPNLYN